MPQKLGVSSQLMTSNFKKSYNIFIVYPNKKYIVLICRIIFKLCAATNILKSRSLFRKGFTAPIFFKAPTTVPNMRPVFVSPHLFSFYLLLNTFYTITPHHPTPRQSIHQPHQTDQPLRNHHIENIYFHQPTRTI